METDSLTRHSWVEERGDDGRAVLVCRPGIQAGADCKGCGTRLVKNYVRLSYGDHRDLASAADLFVASSAALVRLHGLDRAS